ncbi:ABC transporter permease [Candidatus Gracilibacteria bacterium 28_42_T64]|nr:ABC transporter permease [Candidatus Gracilibacteria bacterium 28_42_T64]
MIDLITLTNKEVSRFLRVWKQTLLPPIITIVLYLLIFGKFIGDKISIVEGVNYIDFIFPGLLMMSVIMASYQNTSSSFFGSKFQHNIEELFVSPIAHWKILVGFCVGAILRGMMVGGFVFLVGIFMVDLNIVSYAYMFLFLFLSSTLFALLGLFNGIFAKTFDDIAIIPSFVITPLIYLGGVFYSTDLLSPIWQAISQVNPILYMVNGLRYAFIGITDVNINLAIGILVTFIIIFISANMYLLKKGYGIRN